MDEITIKKLVTDLSWEMPQAKQNKAIELLSKLDENQFHLIFDRTIKSTWENAILVIDKIGMPQNKFFIPTLLWLLQDVNWPGAMQAIDVLLKYDKEIILPLLENTIQDAYTQGDCMWLGGLKILVDKGKNKGIVVGDDTLALLDFSDF